MAVAKQPDANAVTTQKKSSLPDGNQAGATLDTRYLQRVQEVVAVNRNDLEDLLDYDTSALSFGGLGITLLSGAGFILVEQWLTSATGKVNPLMQVCLVLVFFGCFLLWQGKKMHDKKRNRIERIFRETRDYQPLDVLALTAGKNATTARISTRESRLPKDSAAGTTP